MKSLLTTLLFLFTGTIFGQNIVDSFLVDGVYRNYILHIPTGYSSATQHPLVLNLQGYTSNASQEQLYTQMDVTADANNFLVVYPNGISNYWNYFAFNYFFDNQRTYYSKTRTKIKYQGRYIRFDKK